MPNIFATHELYVRCSSGGLAVDDIVHRLCTALAIVQCMYEWIVGHISAHRDYVTLFIRGHLMLKSSSSHLAD